MDTIIIGQGYNFQEDTSVGKELIKQFNSKRYDSFTCLVAFASYSGVSALTKYIQESKERGMSIKVILGIDQKEHLRKPWRKCLDGMLMQRFIILILEIFFIRKYICLKILIYSP